MRNDVGRSPFVEWPSDENGRETLVAVDGQHRVRDLSESLGRFGMGHRAFLPRSTGAGKTLATTAMAMESARRGERVQVVVKDRQELVKAEALLERAQWWERSREPVCGEQVAPEGLRLSPEPYALRRLRARVSSAAEYRALCRRAVEWEESGRDQERRQVMGERRVRNPGARRAVLLRSEGRCENPECLLPDLPYRTRTGDPLLEVDHIDDHAKGGRDHPSAMIALCPNCHSYKTVGEGGTALVERLRTVARRRHELWDAANRSR